MDSIPLRIRRLLFVATVFVVIVVPVLLVFDLHQAMAVGVIVILLVIWLLPGGNRKEMPQDKAIGTEGHDVGNWEPDKEHEP